MDNLTHTLFALTLARTRLGQAGRGTTAALVIASSAPDIDFVASADGALSYLAWHRGPTHGPAGIIGLGLATAGLVWVGRKYLAARRGELGGAREASIGMLALVSIVGVFLHVAMDLATPYGTRVLSPLGWQWVATDWMPIVDVYMLAIMLGGLLLGRDRAVRRRTATIVLALIAGNYGVRAAAHQRAVDAVSREVRPLVPLCEPAGSQGTISSWGGDRGARLRTPATGPCFVDVAALPTFFSPFRWRVVVRSASGYEIQEVDLFDRLPPSPEIKSRPDRAPTIRVSDEWTPAVERASRTRVGRVFLDFSRFPAAQLLEEPDGTATVRWTDMRFVDGSPSSTPTGGAAARRNFFTATVRIGPDGRVLEERLGP